MATERDTDKHNTKRLLERGLAESCADDITEAIINMHNGTCDYVELIPLLEQVAKEKFYYFDDNGAGGLPRADMQRETDFFIWAQQAIENLKANAQLEANDHIAAALKSNSTALIKFTMEQLKAAGTYANELLMPVLKKIAAKNEYKSYSYLSGFQTDCKLGDLAHEVIQMIHQNAESTREDHLSVQPNFEYHLCNVCSSLPDDITVNTGREYQFPDAFRKLKWVSGDNSEGYYRCPSCGTYYEWINMPQMYGSGNCDEERLVRKSQDESRVLEHRFSGKDK